jgi:hypothetical protein
LVNFPQVLTMMGSGGRKNWVGAFLAQQKAGDEHVQSLRAKAHATEQFKDDQRTTAIVEQQIIIIELASPQVTYVPAYTISNL